MADELEQGLARLGKETSMSALPRFRCFARLLIVAATLGTAATAAAASIDQDTKVYPGTMCQTASNGAIFTRDTLGRMINSANVVQGFFCPIVHDVIGGSTTVNIIEQASVVVRGGYVGCTYFAADERGRFVQAGVSPQSITFLPDGSRRLTWAAGASVLPIPRDGFAYLACVGVPGAGVVSYAVTEGLLQR